MDEDSAPQVRHTRPYGQLPAGEEAPPNHVTHRHPRVAQLVPPPQKRITEKKSLKDPEISTKKYLQFQDLQLKHKFSEKQVIYKWEIGHQKLHFFKQVHHSIELILFYEVRQRGCKG